MTETLYVTSVAAEYDCSFFILDQYVPLTVLQDILDTYSIVPCNTIGKTEVWTLVPSSILLNDEQEIVEVNPLDPYYIESGTNFSSLEDEVFYAYPVDNTNDFIGFHGWNHDDITKAVKNYISNTSIKQRQSQASRRQEFLKLCA